jgi:hypothetical protein
MKWKTKIIIGLNSWVTLDDRNPLHESMIRSKSKLCKIRGSNENRSTFLLWISSVNDNYLKYYISYITACQTHPHVCNLNTYNEYVSVFDFVVSTRKGNFFFFPFFLCIVIRRGYFLFSFAFDMYILYHYLLGYSIVYYLVIWMIFINECNNRCGMYSNFPLFFNIISFFPLTIIEFNSIFSCKCIDNN